jgi:hypothetical protein
MKASSFEHVGALKRSALKRSEGRTNRRARSGARDTGFGTKFLFAKAHADWLLWTSKLVASGFAFIRTSIPRIDLRGVNPRDHSYTCGPCS